MKRECDDFPQHNHENCDPDSHEKIIIDYFENRGLWVERLCSAWLPEHEQSPDFRITDAKGLRCLCEVKGLDVSTGALTRSDWIYYHQTRIKQAIDAAEREGSRLILSADEMRLLKKEFPYPVEGRNTEEKEKKYEMAIFETLQRSSIGNEPLQILVSRDDSLVWRESERGEFETWLIASLEAISTDAIPWDWTRNPLGGFIGTFARKRADGRHVRNVVHIESKDVPPLEFRSVSRLEVNWKAVERGCGDAKSQVRDRLKRELEPGGVVRLVIMFLTVDLAMMYVPDMIQELKAEIRRRIFGKFPELSAIAFCQAVPDDDGSLWHGPFRVFHTAKASIPRLPQYVFDSGASGQVVV